MPKYFIDMETNCVLIERERVYQNLFVEVIKFEMLKHA